MLYSLGRKEVENLRAEDPIAEVNCSFCDKKYHIDLNELLADWPTPNSSPAMGTAHRRMRRNKCTAEEKGERQLWN